MSSDERPSTDDEIDEAPLNGAAPNGTLPDHRRGGAWLSSQSQAGFGAALDQPQWIANLQIQRLLSVAMFACVAWALVQALISSNVAPLHALSVGLVATAAYAAGVALGGRANTRNLRRYTDYGLTDWVLLLIPIILVLKLLPYALQGPGAVGAEVSSWMVEPARFWDVSLVWSLILVFFVWDESLRQAEALSQLSLQPGELPPAVNSAEYQEWMASAYRFVNHTAAWERLMWRFVGGGFVLLIFTGVAVIRPDQLGNPDRPEALGVMPHVLLYYLLGLILAGQTSLDRLRTAWLRAGAAVQVGLARRWLGYGLGLAGISLVLSILLPATFNFASASNIPVLSIILLPLRLLFGGFNWLISHIASWLLIPLTWLTPNVGGGASGAGAGQEGRPLPPAELPPDTPGSPTFLSRLVFGFLLYVLPTALALYAIWNTWRKRRIIWHGLRGFGRDVWTLVRGAVLDLLAMLWRIFTFGSPRLMSFAPSAIRARLRRRRKGGALGGGEGGLGWLRLRGLNARALIQYFYVSLTQRAETVGWGRQPGQTAYEYSRDLANRMPQRHDEIAALTEAFVRAKYSPQPVSSDDAKRVRTPWERIRGALQTRRRTHQVGGWLGLNREQSDAAP
jgi:hypothetical protein